MKNTSEDVKGYSLLENGYVHTTGLTLSEVEEMLERHRRIFEDIAWDKAYHGPEVARKNWDK